MRRLNVHPLHRDRRRPQEIRLRVPPRTKKLPRTTGVLSMSRCGLHRISKRRGRDSNPGSPCGNSGSQDRTTFRVTAKSYGTSHRPRRPYRCPALRIPLPVAVFGPDLVRIVDAWDRLPKAICSAILTVVQPRTDATPNDLEGIAKLNEGQNFDGVRQRRTMSPSAWFICGGSRTRSRGSTASLDCPGGVESGSGDQALWQRHLSRQQLSGQLITQSYNPSR